MLKACVALVGFWWSAMLLADCNEFALQGEWTVFYQDNAFPSSVLVPDETISIHYDQPRDEFTLAFTDPNWQAWAGGWLRECVGGQTVLIGAIKQRRGAVLLMIEISKVVDVNDLLARASGVTKLEQINVLFPESFALNAMTNSAMDLSKYRHVASDPGHVHADK